MMDGLNSRSRQDKPTRCNSRRWRFVEKVGGGFVLGYELRENPQARF